MPATRYTRPAFSLEDVLAATKGSVRRLSPPIRTTRVSDLPVAVTISQSDVLLACHGFEGPDTGVVSIVSISTLLGLIRTGPVTFAGPISFTSAVSFSGPVSFTGLQTNDSGLSKGDAWINSGVLMVKL